MKKLFIIIISVIFLGGCNSNSNQPTKTELKTLSIRQEWFPNANFAGELYAMNRTAEKNNIKIKLDAGADNIDPVKLVISGENQIGVAGADKVIAANEKGGNLVVLGVINYNSPTCFLTKENSGITKPSNFVGKKVGVLTGTATEYVYRTILKKQGLDPKKFKEVEAPFDLNTFLAGEYDVRPAFIYDEPVSLDMQNIKYNIINPTDYGVSFLGTVYFATQDFVKSNPELVQSFINSVAEGWELSIQHPDSAIHFLKLYDKQIDEKRELASLTKGISLFKGYEDKVLLCDTDHYNKMVDNLVDLKIVSDKSKAQVLNLKFVENYHGGKK